VADLSGGRTPVDAPDDPDLAGLPLDPPATVSLSRFFLRACVLQSGLKPTPWAAPGTDLGIDLVSWRHKQDVRVGDAGRPVVGDDFDRRSFTRALGLGCWFPLAGRCRDSRREDEQGHSHRYPSDCPDSWQRHVGTPCAYGRYTAFAALMSSLARVRRLCDAVPEPTVPHMVSPLQL